MSLRGADKRVKAEGSDVKANRSLTWTNFGKSSRHERSLEAIRTRRMCNIKVKKVTGIKNIAQRI